MPKCVLVTGAAGFIGSHVAARMVLQYPQTKVVVLDKLDYCASMRNLDCVADKANFRFVQGDICSADLVTYLLTSERVDTVMHFAAQSHVDNSFGVHGAHARALRGGCGRGGVLHAACCRSRPVRHRGV